MNECRNAFYDHRKAKISTSKLADILHVDYRACADMVECYTESGWCKALEMLLAFHQKRLAIKDDKDFLNEKKAFGAGAQKMLSAIKAACKRQNLPLPINPCRDLE